MIEETKDTAVETAVSDETVEIAPEAVTSEDDRVMDKDEALLAKAVSEMKEGHRYKLGQRVKCRVVLVSDDGVYVSIPSSKKEGFIPNEELAMDGNYEAVKRDLNSESVLECAVISLDKGITLSKKSIDERYKDDELVEGIKAGNEFECVMNRVGKECLTGKLGSYTVIVHASQIKIGYVKNLETYVGKKLRLVVTSPDKVDDAKHVILPARNQSFLPKRRLRKMNSGTTSKLTKSLKVRFFVLLRSAHLSTFAASIALLTQATLHGSMSTIPQTFSKSARHTNL